MVKEPGHRILFSELMKGDDGVLFKLLTAQGMSDIEAAGAINRLVFDIRHSLQDGNNFDIEGLGTLSKNASNCIVFSQQTAATPMGFTNTTSSDATPIPTPHVSKSPKIDPDPNLKGLRYRKPRKMHGYSYYSGKKESKVDKLVVIAIIAAVLSIFAIAYGYYTSSHRAEIDKEIIINTDSLQKASEAER